MNKKLVLSLVAFAGMSMAASKTYDLKLYQPAMVGNTELKAGEYRVEVTDDKAVIKGSKINKETAVKVEAADEKYPTTTVRLSAGEKPQIKRSAWAEPKPSSCSPRAPATPECSRFVEQASACHARVLASMPARMPAWRAEA